MAPPLSRAGRTLTVYGYELSDPQSPPPTVLVFHGLSETGRLVRFGVDHRCAQPLAEALAAGEEPVVVVEPWQVLGATVGEEVK